MTETREWKPGDKAITDAYTQGRTEITLIADQHPRYWIVQPGDGKPYGLLYEEEFSRIEPKPVVSDCVRTLYNPDGSIASQTKIDVSGGTPPSRRPEPAKPAATLTSGPTLQEMLQRLPGVKLEPARKHEWKAGDEAITDSGEKVKIARRCRTYPELWHVRPTRDSAFESLVSESRIRRPEPTPIEPSIECEKDWAASPSKTEPRGRSILSAVVGMDLGWPLPHKLIQEAIDESRAKIRAACGVDDQVIADLKAGGLDAVAKHLDKLLESYGINGDDREAIIAQVEGGDRATRETTSHFGTIRGVLAWQEVEPQDRRVWLQVTGHVLMVHVTTIPELRPRKVKFRTPLDARKSYEIVTGIVKSGIDSVVDREDGEIIVLPMVDPDLFA